MGFILTAQERSLQHTEGKHLAPMSALGRGGGGSAPRPHRGPDWLFPGPDHSEVTRQLTARVHVFNLLNCLQQNEEILGEGSNDPKIL